MAQRKSDLDIEMEWVVGSTAESLERVMKDFKEVYVDGMKKFGSCFGQLAERQNRLEAELGKLRQTRQGEEDLGVSFGRLAERLSCLEQAGVKVGSESGQSVSVILDDARVGTSDGSSAKTTDQDSHGSQASRAISRQTEDRVLSTTTSTNAGKMEMTGALTSEAKSNPSDHKALGSASLLEKPTSKFVPGCDCVVQEYDERPVNHCHGCSEWHLSECIGGPERSSCKRCNADVQNSSTPLQNPEPYEKVDLANSKRNLRVRSSASGMRKSDNGRYFPDPNNKRANRAACDGVLGGEEGIMAKPVSKSKKTSRERPIKSATNGENVDTRGEPTADISRANDMSQPREPSQSRLVQPRGVSVNIDPQGQKDGQLDLASFQKQPRYAGLLHGEEITETNYPFLDARELAQYPLGMKDLWAALAGNPADTMIHQTALENLTQFTSTLLKRSQIHEDTTDPKYTEMTAQQDGPMPPVADRVSKTGKINEVLALIEDATGRNVIPDSLSSIQAVPESRTPMKPSEVEKAPTLSPVTNIVKDLYRDEWFTKGKRVPLEQFVREKRKLDKLKAELRMPRSRYGMSLSQNGTVDNGETTSQGSPQEPARKRKRVNKTLSTETADLLDSDEEPDGASFLLERFQARK